MTNAKYEQQSFWEIFEEKLVENGEPFSISYMIGSEVKHFAAVNKKSPRVPLGLTVDFLYRERIVKINVYIENDVRLFNYVYARREQIEQELGFKPQWILGGTRNPNTRRAISTFPVTIGDRNDYARVIDDILPYLLQYKRVFEKYIPNLCDF